MKAPVKQGDIIFQWLLFRGYRDSRDYRESREGGGRQKEGPPILCTIFFNNSASGWRIWRVWGLRRKFRTIALILKYGFENPKYMVMEMIKIW